MSEMNVSQDGGAAFPIDCVLIENTEGSLQKEAGQSGMSLRDYFAAKAMQGLSSNTVWVSFVRGFINGEGVKEHLAADRGLEYMANEAYRIADAMLKARAK